MENAIERAGSRIQAFADLGNCVRIRAVGQVSPSHWGAAIFCTRSMVFSSLGSKGVVVPRSHFRTFIWTSDLHPSNPLFLRAPCSQTPAPVALLLIVSGQGPMLSQ
jgi:hypothetical protein